MYNWESNFYICYKDLFGGLLIYYFLIFIIIIIIYFIDKIKTTQEFELYFQFL